MHELDRAIADAVFGYANTPCNRADDVDRPAPKFWKRLKPP